MATPKRYIPERFLGNHQHEKKRARAAPEPEKAEQENQVSVNVPPAISPEPKSVSLPTHIAFGKKGVRSLGGAAVVRTRTLYIANVPFSATADQLSELLQPYGRVAAVRLPKMGGRPSGRAYVDIEAECAERAVAALNGAIFGGRKLLAEIARESRALSAQQTVSAPAPSADLMHD